MEELVVSSPPFPFFNPSPKGRWSSPKPVHPTSSVPFAWLISHIFSANEQYFSLKTNQPTVLSAMAYQPSLSVRTYQPAYQLESTVFFSHNKIASAGFNTSRTGQSWHYWKMKLSQFKHMTILWKFWSKMSFILIRILGLFHLTHDCSETSS